jgi:UDP-N-acetyl-D-mannosaminuronic acid dehydrogenase
LKLPYQKVSVIGLGYIGLPTAATLASRDVEVVGVDVNPQAVAAVNNGRIHIVEPDLNAVVHQAVMKGKLRAVTKPEESEVFILAVPTPFKGKHKPDLSYVKAAGKSIASVLKKGDLVILESTSPVGTTEKLSVWLAEARKDLTFPHQKGEKADVQLAYCPERVLPGKVLQELVQNARIIGGLTPKATRMAKALYQIFVTGQCLESNARTAEMAKLTENAFRDVNIAFANELSMICEKMDVDVWKLIELANHHPRVKILQPGPGVGGHCIAVDPWFIVDSAPALAKMIQTAREVNDGKPHHVVERVRKEARRSRRPIVACLGLAFKPDIDDLRESPAMEIALELARDPKFRLLIVEPHVNELPPVLEAFSNVELVSLEDAVKRAGVVVLLVNHRVFYNMDTSLLKDKIIVDTRGMWRSLTDSKG